MGLAIKTSEKTTIRHLGSHHISWRGICYCCSLKCTIINSEAIYLTSCWMGVFLYRLHDNWLYHNFAEISPSNYIRWMASFKLLNDWLRCFYGIFCLGHQRKVLVSLLLSNIFQNSIKYIIKAKGMIIIIIKQIAVTVYKNIIENEILS